jgi:uncharacterized protein YaiE (UPF0345 family)
MKTKNLGLLLSILFFGALGGQLLLSLIDQGATPLVNAATVSRGTTFTTNQLVQYTDLHNLVDNATVSAIVSADITDGTIIAADISDSTITSVKIVDSTIVTADILNRTIISDDIATNAVTEIELHTNITTRAGFLNISNSTFTANMLTPESMQGVTTSAGAGDSGKIPKLNASGLFDSSFLPVAAVISNTVNTTTSSGTAYVWTPVCAVTSTVTRGAISVVGKASVFSANSVWCRVRDSNTNIVSVGVCKASALDNGTAESTLLDVLSGSTKIYWLDVATDGTSIALTNQYDTASSPLVGNGLGIWINQKP